MRSIVVELQQAAIDKEAEIDDLLRKCVLIAFKLQLVEFLAWAKRELNGYGCDETLPDYRVVPGMVQAYNPYNGHWMPFMWPDGPPQELKQRGVMQPVAELQDLLSDKDRMLLMSLPEKTAYRLMRNTNAPQPPVFVISPSSVHGILDAVRNEILDWSLKLEANGILGEGMTFTEKEKQNAMTNTYNIQNFSGVLGNVTSKNLQIGDYNSIHGDLKELGITQTERNLLEHLMDQTPKASGTEKATLVEKGLEWVLRNSNNLGHLSEAIRGWFQNAA